MRFASVTDLAHRASVVFIRFPETILIGIATAALGIVATQVSAQEVWVNAAFVVALGLPLTVTLTLLADAKGWPAAWRWGAQGAGLLLLGLFYAVWPGIDSEAGAVRYAQTSALLHLAAAFLPFLGRAESGGFWRFNYQLLIASLRAAVFAGVLFLGLLVAIAALQKLFGLQVNGMLILDVWLVAAFVVATWVFLAAVPPELEGLEADFVYPRVLKVFAQYILTPLAFGYLVILLAYLVKLVLGAEWPSGWIGWLVASVAATGLLGFLLVHPLRTQVAEGWIRIYARWLFVGLIPAAVMLLLAFWKRIVPYGLTEPRVMGVLLGLWLLGIALLYTLRPASGVRPIPQSLALLLFLTWMGPTSLTSISVRSQGARLAELLAQPDSTAERDREASAAVRYLLSRGAQAELSARLGAPVTIAGAGERKNGTSMDAKAQTLLMPHHVAYRDQWSGPAGPQTIFLSARESALTIDGYRWLTPLYMRDTTARVLGGDTVQMLRTPDTAAVMVRVGSDTLRFDLLGFAAARAVDGDHRNGMAADSMLIVAQGSGRRAALAVIDVSAERREKRLHLSQWNARLLLGGKP